MNMVIVTKGRRFLYAVLISAALHGVLLGGALFFAGTGLFRETSEEIYAVNEDAGNALPDGTTAVSAPNRAAMKKLPAGIKFVLVNAAEAKALEGKTEAISRELEKERRAQERKQVPVVRNPAVRPKLIRYQPVPYPPAAGGASGTVMVVILVGYDGRPEYASLAGSSGNRFLDAAAVEHCIEWQFTPARDAKGRLVRCLVYIPVPLKQ